ncbi:MAG: hypothetical protein WCP96_10635, partial [Methylococcaceae bacterium]
KPNRNIRGPGRNVRRNLAPVNNTADETVELVKNQPVADNEAAVTEATILAPEGSASPEEQAKQAARKSTGRRGPNRRRPRNPNYKKADDEGDSNDGEGDSSGGGSEVSADTQSEARPAPSRSYDSDFAERVERAERPEPQAPVSVTPEPQKTMTESAPKAVESTKQDAPTE